MSALAKRSDLSWRRVGLQIGSELGELDRVQNVRRRPDQLSIAANTPDAYVTALREAYLAALNGTPILAEVM